MNPPTQTDAPHPSQIELPSKPGAPITYTFFAPSPSQISSPRLILFLNGLIAPASKWYPSIQAFKQLAAAKGEPLPAMITYDRFGQGLTTSRDPLDSREGMEEGYGHTPVDVVNDLSELVDAWKNAHFSGLEGELQILLVANSIGGPHSRLFAAKRPELVRGIIFLDSMIAHADYVSMFPDPSSPTFDAATVLPEGVTLEEYITAREMYKTRFHPTVKNNESLDRRHLPVLLPKSDEPTLYSNPLLTIIAHDPETFAQQASLQKNVLPLLTRTFVEPHWDENNAGLGRLTEAGEGKVVGPKYMRGAGHFVQMDRADGVGEEMAGMCGRLRWWEC